MCKVMLGHQQRGLKRRGAGRQTFGPGCHDLSDRGIQRCGDVGHQCAQVPEGKDTYRPPLVLNNHNAAHPVVVHQGYGLAYRQVGLADDRRAQGVLLQRSVQTVAGTYGGQGPGLDALVYLIKEAADTTQAVITEWLAFRKQRHKVVALNAQAECVARGAVQSAGRALTYQSGEWEALALADFEGGFGPLSALVVSLPADSTLFDNVKAGHGAIIGRQHHVPVGIKTQAGVLGKMGQMGIVHIRKRRMLSQKRHNGASVLGVTTVLGGGCHDGVILMLMVFARSVCGTIVFIISVQCSAAGYCCTLRFWSQRENWPALWQTRAMVEFTNLSIGSRQYHDS